VPFHDADAVADREPDGGLLLNGNLKGGAGQVEGRQIASVSSPYTRLSGLGG